MPYAVCSNSGSRGSAEQLKPFLAIYGQRQGATLDESLVHRRTYMVFNCFKTKYIGSQVTLMNLIMLLVSILRVSELSNILMVSAQIVFNS